MKPTIEFRDNKDAFLLGEAIIRSIAELAELRDKAGAWGCSKMEMQDRIDRFQRMLHSLNYEEE